MGNVVAVSHVGEGLPLQVTEGLQHREIVRQCLAGMLQVSEGIDHGDGSPVGVIHQFLLREGANSQRVAETTEHAGRVLQRFAAAQLSDLRIEINGLPAEACHCNLETHPGACGCLGEDQPKNPVAKINASIA